MGGDPRIKSDNDWQKAGDVLSGILRNLGLDRHLKQRELVLRWEEIVGPRIAEKSRVLKVSGGVLYVSVTSSAWGQELQFQKKNIMRKITEELGTDLIKDIRIRGN